MVIRHNVPLYNSPHFRGPRLSAKPYLGESDVKLSHPFIHLYNMGMSYSIDLSKKCRTGNAVNSFLFDIEMQQSNSGGPQFSNGNSWSSCQNVTISYVHYNRRLRLMSSNTTVRNPGRKLLILALRRTSKGEKKSV